MDEGVNGEGERGEPERPSVRPVRFHQLGYVTNSMEQARRVFAETLGVIEFRESERKFESREHGRTGESLLRTALANTDAVQYEIVQPLAGQISVFADALSGDGFILELHHVAYRVEGTFEDWRRHLDALEEGGRRPSWQSARSESAEFAYVDDRATLGHFTEYLWSTEGRWRAMMNSVPFNPRLIGAAIGCAGA